MSSLFKSSSIASCLDDMEADTVELSVLLLGKISQVAPHLVLFFVPRQDTQVVILLELEVKKPNSLQLYSITIIIVVQHFLPSWGNCARTHDREEGGGGIF